MTLKWGKRILTFVLSAAMLFSTFAPIQYQTYAANGPLGIANHWAQIYLQNLYTYGIMRGDQEGNMNPDEPITRAEFASMLNRAFGYNSFKRGDLPFKDIKGTEWYADDIAIAYQAGYFAGTSATTANPQGYLTREQAVALLCRNLKLDEPVGEVLGFTDSREFSQWSKGSIAAFMQKGYVSGYADNSFRPEAYISRGETAKILSDIIGYRISSSGNYQQGIVQGNVMITTSAISLENTTIMGDLYITAGVGTGYVDLRNVRVMGDVIISGGGSSEAGANSINFIGCQVNRLIVDGEEDKVLSLDSYGNTVIAQTLIRTSAYLENYGDETEGFVNIIVEGPEETTLATLGDFDKITVRNPKNYLVVGRGTVQQAIVDETAADSKVTIEKNAAILDLNLDVTCIVDGLGDVGNLTVSGPDTEVSMRPDTITIRPGITATIDGEELTSSDAAEYSADPRILAGYPDPDEVSSTKASMLYKTNKGGTIYWAVTFEEDSGILDDEEIMNPKKAEHAQDILTYGNSPVAEANQEISSAISNLSPEMEYSVAAVLVDERGYISRVKEKDFETVDDTIPAFASGYPQVFSDDSNSLSIGFLPTKNCTVYYAVYQTGSVAPTALELRKGQLKGAIVHGSTKGQKNIEDIVVAASNELQENTKYDVYVVASDGIRDSKVIKLTGTTKDTTPPKFIDGFPKEDKRDKKSVDVKAKVDEDSTIFYAVVKKGSTLLPLREDGTEYPLDSDEMKNAVVTGNTAYKSGKSNAKADTELTVKISGLEEEKAYDLYMAARDASGNISIVEKISIQTLDSNPPKAELTYDKELNGKVHIDAQITILFNEIVINRNTGEEFSADNLDAIEECIKLYAVKDSGNELIDMNLDAADDVKVGMDEEGRSYITFVHASEFLKSGQSYKFVLSNIADTSNNKMNDETELPFATVPPTVTLEKTTSPEDMDLTFQIEPEKNATEDAILFDMIFGSDTTVKFELYKKNAQGSFEQIGGTQADGSKYTPLILENQAMSLDYIVTRSAEGAQDYAFVKFNTMTEPEEYGIRFVEVDGSADCGSWNKTVKIDIKCVIGSKTVLSQLAGNPKNGWSTAISEGALQVNNPEPFVLSASFTDTIVPQFVIFKDASQSSTGEDIYYPILNRDGEKDESGKEISFIGDTLIQPRVMTNKKATMYYLIAPKGTVDEDKLTPLQLMTGAVKPQGGVWGTYEIESGYTEYGVLMEGLQPTTKYTLFCCLKGTPPEPSDITIIDFETVAMSPPNIEVRVINRAETSATVQITSDKAATIDWIMIPDLNCDSWFQIDSSDPTQNKYQFIGDPIYVASVIRNGAENQDLKPVDYGSIRTTYNEQDKKYTATVTVDNLERNIYYTFLAVAKATLDNGETNVGADSNIAFQRKITPADVMPPTVTENTSITNWAASQSPYYGTVLFTFNEEVFYIPGENEKWLPLTIEVFTKNMSATTDKIEVKSSTMQNNTIKSITIQFKGINHNDSIFFPYEICDKNGNSAGLMTLTFKDEETGPDGAGRRDSHWEISFSKSNE